MTEYRRRVEQRSLDLVAYHPTVQAIQRGDAVDRWFSENEVREIVEFINRLAV